MIGFYFLQTGKQDQMKTQKSFQKFKLITSKTDEETKVLEKEKTTITLTSGKTEHQTITFVPTSDKNTIKIQDEDMT